MLECPSCQGRQVVKNGKAKNGTQTYVCRTCGRRFHPDAKPVAHNEATRTQVFDALHERMSLRGVQRVFGVHRHTVTLWIKKKPMSWKHSQRLLGVPCHPRMSWWSNLMNCGPSWARNDRPGGCGLPWNAAPARCWPGVGAVRAVGWLEIEVRKRHSNFGTAYR